MVRAKSVIVHCGDSLRDWTTLVYRFYDFDRRPNFDFARGIDKPDRHISTTSYWYKVAPLHNFRSERSPTNCSSFTLIENMRNFCISRTCEDRRDNVYALLSISKVPAVIEPDYTITMPELFLRIYALHYLDGSFPWLQRGMFREEEALGPMVLLLTFEPVACLFETMGLSAPEICTVIDMLFTNPIDHPSDGSDLSYAALVLVAAQFHMQNDQDRFKYRTDAQSMACAYNEVMPLVHSEPRAAATEMARRLRAAQANDEYTIPAGCAMFGMRKTGQLLRPLMLPPADHQSLPSTTSSASDSTQYLLETSPQARPTSPRSRTSRTSAP